MDQEQRDDLIGLAVDGELPAGLARLLKAEATADAGVGVDLAGLRHTVARLRAMPAERPDPWYVERALLGLLREHDAETPVAAEVRRAA